MAEPRMVQKAPYRVEMSQGQSCYWCRCGLSTNQPFCDGSHKNTDFTPEPYRAEKDGPVYLCGCKQTNNSPLCDGTHNKI